MTRPVRGNYSEGIMPTSETVRKQVGLVVNPRAGRPTVSWTPTYFERVYKLYRNGYVAELAEMMNEAQIDPYVSGCLNGRRAAVKRDLIATPFEDTDKDRERAEWLKKTITNLKFGDLCEDIQTARLQFYSVISFDEWDLVDGFQVPISHTWHAHKYFRYDTKPDDKRLKVDWGKDLREIPPDVMIAEYKKMPAMLPAVWMYILKKYGVNAWASFLETWGEPILIGYHPIGASKEIREALKTALDEIASASRGSMPDTRDGSGNSPFEIIETNKTTGDHEKFIALSEKSTAISLLGHANAVEQSQAQIGENQEAWKATRNVAIDDCDFVKPYIQWLGNLIYNQNISDGRIPELALDTKPPLNQKEHRQNVELLMRHGVPVHRDDVQKLGLKVDPEKEWIQKESKQFDFEV